MSTKHIRCSISGCPVKFKKTSHMKVHANIIHGTNKTNGKFECMECTQRGVLNWYLGEYQLQHHRKAYHQESPPINPPPIVSDAPSTGWRERMKDESKSSMDSPSIKAQTPVSDVPSVGLVEKMKDDSDEVNFIIDPPSISEVTSKTDSNPSMLDAYDNFDHAIKKLQIDL